jgi:hypothetical protein
VLMTDELGPPQPAQPTIISPPPTLLHTRTVAPTAILAYGGRHGMTTRGQAAMPRRHPRQAPLFPIPKGRKREPEMARDLWQAREVEAVRLAVVSAVGVVQQDVRVLVGALEEFLVQAPVADAVVALHAGDVRAHLAAHDALVRLLGQRVSQLLLVALLLLLCRVSRDGVIPEVSHHVR